MPETQQQEGTSKSAFCVVIRTFLSSFWHTENSFVRRYGCLRVHQEKGVTYQFTESRSLAFHAITGCDTTSQFYGVGKASAWKVFEDAPDLLEHLGEESQISADVLVKAEAFVCKLYNPGTQEVEINKERAAEFRKSKKDLDALPPTQDALILHIKRANYQTMVWKKALEPCPSLPTADGTTVKAF